MTYIHFKVFHVKYRIWKYFKWNIKFQNDSSEITNSKIYRVKYWMQHNYNIIVVGHQWFYWRAKRGEGFKRPCERGKKDGLPAKVSLCFGGLLRGRKCSCGLGPPGWMRCAFYSKGWKENINSSLSSRNYSALNLIRPHYLNSRLHSLDSFSFHFVTFFTLQRHAEFIPGRLLSVLLFSF